MKILTWFAFGGSCISLIWLFGYWFHIVFSFQCTPPVPLPMKSALIFIGLLVACCMRNTWAEFEVLKKDLLHRQKKYD